VSTHKVRSTGLRTLVVALVTLAALAGCDLERSRLMKEKYPAYPEHIKRAIDQGYPVHGMDHDQVYLVFGEPICKKTIQYQGRPVEVWLYPPGGRNPCDTAEFRVYFEDGAVTSWQRVQVPSGGG